jgi:hypothetical protein
MAGGRPDSGGCPGSAHDPEKMPSGNLHVSSSFLIISTLHNI